MGFSVVAIVQIHILFLCCDCNLAFRCCTADLSIQALQALVEYKRGGAEVLLLSTMASTPIKLSYETLTSSISKITITR